MEISEEARLKRNLMNEMNLVKKIGDICGKMELNSKFILMKIKFEIHA